MAQGSIYKVTFLHQGEVWEVFARQVSQGGLFGFVEIEELSFGDASKIVVDPSQERLAKEFEGVRRTYVPLHSVLRIDEVEKEGSGRITRAESGAGVAQFPSPVYTPEGGSEKS
ncbi:MAG: DUF1820 family protein [Thermoanaerobaculia bacterium]|nr:DUF1820 family protein [Thermoanaerobaculia bacterium]